MAYYEWPISNESPIFVYCNKCTRDKLGTNLPRPAAIRFACMEGHEAVVLEDCFSFSTVGDLNRFTKSDSPLRMYCHGCVRSTTGKAFFKCRGMGSDGQRCSATSMDGDCAWLPQAISTPPGQECAIYRTEVDDAAMLRFDPCGCLVSVEALQAAVRNLVQTGFGESRLAESPASGQFSFTCPVGGDLCRSSFLHDIHHFKLCGDSKWYCHLKTWAAQNLAYLENANCVVEAEDECMLKSIQEALVQGSCQVCPKCDAAGQKDGACIRITCSQCFHKWCYICRGPNGCCLFLTEIEELGVDAFAAVQEFHLTKTKHLLKILLNKDAFKFEQCVESNPCLLQDLCKYDGTDASGRFDKGSVRVGTTITLDQIRNFVRPNCLR